MAWRRFPSAEACADRILRDGSFCGHGTSLEEFLDRFEGEPWWDVGMDATAAILRSREFRTGFRQWLVSRRRYAIRRFVQELSETGGLTLLRVMQVQADWHPATSGLGRYWSFACPVSVRGAFNADSEQGGVEIAIRAEASPDAVNWEETLLSRMDYLNGDDEGEVQLRPGSRVSVLGVDGLPASISGIFSV